MKPPSAERGEANKRASETLRERERERESEGI